MDILQVRNKFVGDWIKDWVFGFIKKNYLILVRLKNILILKYYDLISFLDWKNALFLKDFSILLIKTQSNQPELDKMIFTDLLPHSKIKKTIQHFNTIIYI